ncbi:ATP-binding cassette domain-containing protein [Streptomyces sp. NPDC018019]|uniref:ATP-binding cassette domain-containing protein n=1 Tax=Streptomyces sp. NPDC018019 TaxID=3365030 RepID=UPI003787C97A
MGENGASKSTRAQALTGLFLPTAGSVRWDGVGLADAAPATVLSKVALVPQDYTRWPLVIRENITPTPGLECCRRRIREMAGVRQRQWKHVVLRAFHQVSPCR